MTASGSRDVGCHGCEDAAASRRRNLMTCDRACGLIPCSHSALMTPRVSRRSPFLLFCFYLFHFQMHKAHRAHHKRKQNIKEQTITRHMLIPKAAVFDALPSLPCIAADVPCQGLTRSAPVLRLLNMLAFCAVRPGRGGAGDWAGYVLSRTAASSWGDGAELFGGIAVRGRGGAVSGRRARLATCVCGQAVRRGWWKMQSTGRIQKFEIESWTWVMSNFQFQTRVHKDCKTAGRCGGSGVQIVWVMAKRL